MDIVLDFLENSHGNVCSEFSLKLSSPNMSFVNYFGLKFSPDFQNTEELARGSFTKVVVQHQLSCDEIFKLKQRWFKVTERYKHVY